MISRKQASTRNIVPIPCTLVGRLCKNGTSSRQNSSSSTSRDMTIRSCVRPRRSMTQS